MDELKVTRLDDPFDCEWGYCSRAATVRVEIEDLEPAVVCDVHMRTFIDQELHRPVDQYEDPLGGTGTWILEDLPMSLQPEWETGMLITDEGLHRVSITRDRRTLGILVAADLLDHAQGEPEPSWVGPLRLVASKQ